MPNDPQAREKTRALTLSVIIEDRYRTYVGMVHEQQVVPYGRRTVQIQLTPEQRNGGRRPLKRPRGGGRRRRGTRAVRRRRKRLGDQPHPDDGGHGEGLHAVRI